MVTHMFIGIQAERFTLNISPKDNKNHILDNGWDLLKKIGYSRLSPVWIGEW